jgi:transcriptional regulator with XRE-family HTH domain
VSAHKDRMNPVAHLFGVNLRSCRHNAGLSQEELGFRARLHRTEIGLLERGQREPQLGTIIKLAGTLSVPPENLLKGLAWIPARIDQGRFECTSTDAS